MQTIAIKIKEKEKEKCNIIINTSNKNVTELENKCTNILLNNISTSLKDLGILNK